MPPWSRFLWEVQNALNINDAKVWAELPRKAWEFLTGNEGPERRDITGFPRWWLEAPSVVPFNWRRSPFNLSKWVIEQVRNTAAKALPAEVSFCLKGQPTLLTYMQDADVPAFVADMKAVEKGIRQIQISALERARAAHILHEDSEKVFELTHAARQAAATYAQRRYEAAHGLPEADVPLQVPIPEQHPGM